MRQQEAAYTDVPSSWPDPPGPSLNPGAIMHIRSFLAAGAVALAAACSGMPGMSGGPPVKIADGVYTGNNGMTLYTFDRDTAGSGKSVCNAQCAAAWPPLYADDSAQASGAWTVITRDDGRKQWALNGKPVYFFARDTKPGERSGDNFNNVWRLAKS
jgi:predicted lipoprotein with Yx(FWY)xxD motif